MEEIKPCPIFEFNDNQLMNVRKCFGYDDLNKLKQDIDQFQDWISKQPHFRLKEFDRDFLERYLIYSKGSIERAKQRFDKLCTFTNLMPEFLQNYDIRNEFKPLFNICTTCILPKPSSDNYRVLITTLTGVDDSNFELVSYYRYLIVAILIIIIPLEALIHPSLSIPDLLPFLPCFERYMTQKGRGLDCASLNPVLEPLPKVQLGHYMLQHDYCNGYELVGDSRNITMGTVRKLNPVTIHKALTLIVEALGQRMKKIHLISGSKFFDTILLVFKQALSAKLAQRLVIHNSVESLYDHIPREQLPKELGGNEKTMKEMAEMDFKEISTDEHIANVKNMENASTDESCRQSCKFNEEYSGMPGSFKTLCVD